MVKILHILSTGDYSGAENVAIQIIRGTTNKFNSIYLAQDGSISNVLKNEGIEHILVNKVNIKSIRKTVMSIKPDLIHAHDYKATIFSSIAVLDIPIVSHLHHNPPWIRSINRKTLLFYLISWRINTILGVSESVINEHVFNKLINNKSIIIGNPVCSSNVKEKVSNQYHEYFDLIFLGRLVRQKNPLRFISIVGSLLREFPQIKVAIVGNGELMEDIKHNVSIKNMTNNITMFGFLENPYDILNNSKILCITSEWEGFGLVAIEALSLGVPVVTTKVGGLANIITPDCGGFCNSDEEFVREISLLLSNTKYYNVKKEKKNKRAEELSNENSYFDKLSDVYYSIVNTAKKFESGK